MSKVDVSRQTRSLLQDAAVLHHLPPDLLQDLRNHASSRLLDAVAQAALIPALTDRIFIHFEDIFADICARWILNSSDSAAAFARVLPFAPYLSQFLTCSPIRVHDSAGDSSPLQLHLQTLDESFHAISEAYLLESLITTWRLLNFDLRLFTPLASLSYMQQLFSHSSSSVRYVAIRIYCLLLHASDLKLERLVQEYCGRGEVAGVLDGSTIDYTFLSFHEHARAQRILTLRQRRDQAESGVDESDCLHQLTPYVLSYGRVLLPRPHGPAHETTSLVMTATTAKSIENFASMLQKPAPILLHGPPGAGKTALVHQVARELGMYSSMVTLHLNEQTDAKMLIGLYSTDSKPGSFQWRPGVLTTAVKEGRWVLVEDLDRAPTEVLSTLLPLIERRELLIASRGERICAADSFRLFATIRTSVGMNGQRCLQSFLGMRFWQSLDVEPPIQSELEQVILHLHPMLHKFTPGILAVYNRLCQLTSNPSLMSRGRSVMSRTLNLRDLLKWCRRLAHCLNAAGMKSGDEAISETTRDHMFMEALDCFVGSCPDTQLGQQLTYAIAEEMHMSRERADHYLTANIPPLDESTSTFSVGRVQLRKKKKTMARMERPRQPFANTCHAKRLLEQISMAVKLEEPVLLVGETGIGKTTVVQQLADSLGHKLVAVNLSQQSEVGDLLGGFKPVNVRSLAVPLKEQFEDLFAATGISASKNQKYLDQIERCFAKGQWPRLCKLWQEAPRMFAKIVADLERLSLDARQDDEQPTKRRKTQSKLHSLDKLRSRWDNFSSSLQQFDVHVSGGSHGFAFSFVEGNIIKAVRNGDWVLLDEINLASPDTLESIADLLTGTEERPTILLSETGQIDKITAHPDFRIFGAMNPATDVGKRDLPTGIRSRFTEIYVHSPDRDVKDLVAIIKTYLGRSSVQNDQAADDMARLYLNTKRMAEERRLVDGANEVPHFSLRTLTRVLSYITTIAPLYGVRRALYEGFSMGFLTLLDRDSENMLLPLIHHHLFDKHGNAQSLLSQPPKHPNDGKHYVKFQNQSKDRQYWLFQGGQTPMERQDYIITPYVERNLLNLVRATSTRRFPILIQGPTSAGKTSMIEYLANFTGNKFLRINNHEHTDLQEYLGTYISGSDGKLRFQEGLLVQAMRQGHWIVLDELNLAPTDVLEALNRLLDDNRELLIPETQQVVRPHENFILFATQNPPGLYAGRKVLSRAFRNRFLELHFDDIPEDELEFILQKRSRNTSPPDCRRIVAVYKELSRLRQTSRLFEQKHSFATLRDLFRWALREAETREDIAAHGFMLLAERVRNEEERIAVKEIIERIFKVTIDPTQLYSADFAPELKQLTKQGNSQDVVWTHSMRRLYVLVYRALRNNEPVLLVGETGCGKTTVCQLLAEALKTQLHIVNAHQNMETGDLIGSQRPVRNRGAILDVLEADLTEVFEMLGQSVAGSIEDKLNAFRALDKTLVAAIPKETLERIAANEARAQALFEWSDGTLVEAMKGGHFFLLDEISLADDSVLERLNSVLEPQRTLLLAEKGVDNSLVVAADGFQFFATMNPGGDFGKKELSPALRNRFTEIWVPPLSSSQDIYEIVQNRLVDVPKRFVDAIVEFATWFGATFRPMATTQFSVREILGWVQLINARDIMSFVDGASAIFIDSIGANPSATLDSNVKTIHQQRLQCLAKLGSLFCLDLSEYDKGPLPAFDLKHGDTFVRLDLSRQEIWSGDCSFSIHAPTTTRNLKRLIRALKTDKPILLEGRPGVGKTTLITALAKACEKRLTRINLSDQTDLMDLFGSDVPVEGKEAGHFAWRDGPFLKAMQKGEWVLLDEMNLASQSVLEGLNACLDHRGEVYIAELDQVFKRHPDFRVFAAQNPHLQGGGRKGLPASFINRFIVVYVDVFTDDDLRHIVRESFDAPGTINDLVGFISELDRQVAVEKSFGSQGGPWEFNLRDILRWTRLVNAAEKAQRRTRGEFDRDFPLVDDFVDVVFMQRFRTEKDRQEARAIFKRVMGREPQTYDLCYDVSSTVAQVGLTALARHETMQPERLPCIHLGSRAAEVKSLMICVDQNMPCIVSGPSGCGKSTLLQYVAALAGKSMAVFPMNADVDAMDLVGGFEQADPLRQVNEVLSSLRDFLQVQLLSSKPSETPLEALQLLSMLAAHSYDVESLEAIRGVIQDLIATISPDSPVARQLERAREVLAQPLQLENPRFEWLDGVIVKAMQTGQWLVLDNANMCNASVLDRLNSLLEPGGALFINEHCDAEGRPRVIKPHREFRIFLTTDPRHGELSRAMRNRAVEIYLYTPPPASVDACFDRICSVESGLARFKQVAEFCHSFPADDQPALESLSFNDVSMLGRFINMFYGHADWDNLPMESFQKLWTYCQSVVGSTALKMVSTAYELATINGRTGKSGVVGCGFEGTDSVCAYNKPIHPLASINLIRSLDENIEIEALESLGASFDFHHQIFLLQGVVDGHGTQARSAKIASLNRLQRSLISQSVAAVSKDSTVKVGAFLSATMEAMLGYLGSSKQDPVAVKEHCSVLRFFEQYLDKTISLCTQPDFDQVRFQAHCEFGIRFLKSREILPQQGRLDQAFVSNILCHLETSFDRGFKLTTGLSMEPLWLVLRPTPYFDKKALQQAVELAGLASRFDAVRWRGNASVAELGKAQRTLEQAYMIVRKPQSTADELVSDLTLAVESLESHVGHRTTDLQPYLSTQFELVRQLSMLQALHSRRQDLTASSDLNILSNASTAATAMLASVEGAAGQLQFVDCLIHQHVYPWHGTLVTGLWDKLQGLGRVSLGSLALMEEELPAMGRHVSELSADIADDAISKLCDMLEGLVRQVLAAVIEKADVDFFIGSIDSWIQHHGVAQQGSFKMTAFEFNPPEAPHLTSIFLEHLIPAMISLSDARNQIHKRAYHSALAWIHFSTGLVKLYVPDRVVDPQFRLQVELEFHNKVEMHLKDKVSSLRKFEKSLTGQQSSHRIRLLESELAALEPPPTGVEYIYRPDVSELYSLHAELVNVIKVVTGPTLATILKSFEAGSLDECNDSLRFVKANVERLIDRLSWRFEAYQDMTRPVVNMLQCLMVGMSLCDAAAAEGLIPATVELVNATPFIGGGQGSCMSGRPSAKSFEYLDLISLAVAVEGWDSLSMETRESIFECFHGFYDDWCKKLEADRKEEAARTSMYRFRGAAEDEQEIDEEEFNELFPSYKDDAAACKPAAKVDEIRTTSIKVARAHDKIFHSRQDAQSAMREACMAVGHRVADETRGYSSIESSVDGKLLATTCLLLEEKLDKLQSACVGASYNFYTDANLGEARKLVSLTHKIERRFRELQRVDEIGHMQPLEDVVQCCDRLLEHTHSEPLAKLLPGVERLHGHVYEWQYGGWASKVHGADGLVECLSDTIIRWRRLELSTWARLFDMEVQKCQDDGYSWWFVAFQVVVAVPLSMMEDSSSPAKLDSSSPTKLDSSPTKLDEYAVSLMQSLDTYLSTSIVGQFKTRVALLRQLLSHLRLLARDYPQIQVISRAVGSFIDYYARYETLADAAITRGRAPIEAKMKDVLLMASWKDTNINALGESAQKSHHKLFRLVRKFRGVLGQQMKTLIEQGPPDETFGQQQAAPVVANGLQDTAAQDTATQMPETQVQSLRQVLPGWLEKHKRLANASTTISVLERIRHGMQGAESAGEAAANTLDDFVSGLNGSMAELRKETPQFLNDENKDQVKHLKTRKRNLFADTLRDLRQMGLNYNLAQDKLAGQESLAVVLASLAPVHLANSTAFKQAEYHLHKTLHLAPSVRATGREHSDDVTNAEVGRGIGFVEGMIYFSLGQRMQLGTACSALVSLQSAADEFRQLGNLGALGQLSRRYQRGSSIQVLPWLSEMVPFAIKLIQTHGRLGHADLGAVVKELQTWASNTDRLLVESKKLGRLPEQLTSIKHKELEAQVDLHLSSMRAALIQFMMDKPNIAVILRQVEAWTHPSSQECYTSESATSISDCADAISTLTDTILVAVERANKAMGLPREEDEHGWLKRQNNDLLSVLQQLHMADVDRSVRDCIHLAQQIDLAQPYASAAIMSVFGLASAVLDKFALFCSQSVDRAMELHRATTNMAFNLTKAFLQIASQGFCTPQEKSDEKSGDTGQLESGTGLGEGEGAKDISKDIQPDEDLSELAQEVNKEQSGEIEDEKDAVDMADEELEGEMGSVQGADDDDDDKGSQKDDEEDENEMDEEAGDVDDLDPTAVDEKMWDGDDEKAEKDQQGNKAAGQKQEDEQMAADEDLKQGDAEETKQDDKAGDEGGKDEMQDEADDEQEDEAAAREELNRQDQNVDQNDALELPEDMELDFDDQGSASSDDQDLDDLSDVEDESGKPEEQEGGGDEDENMTQPEVKAGQEEDKAEEDEAGEDKGEEDVDTKTAGEDEIQDEVQEETEEPPVDQETEQQPPRPADNANTDAEKAAPSDVKSSGMDDTAEPMQLDEPFQAQAAQQDHGDMGDGAADQDTNAGNAGATARSNKAVEEREREQQEQESGRSNPFRKLGDALEKWHRQQSDIHEAQPKADQAAEQEQSEMGKREFEHLGDDDDAADTQAMGKADKDEVEALDDAMAIDDETQDVSSRLMEADAEDDKEDQGGVDKMDVDDESDGAEAQQEDANDADNEHSGVQTRRGNYKPDEEDEDEQDRDLVRPQEQQDVDDETLSQLCSTHISARIPRDYNECVAQWSQYQGASHALSQSLASQLRLILLPSQATKLNGGFRTGKRLNIKRIIPYIASSYKRDKIWMRRATPSRRNYQIVVCVDDSKSMGESASGRLAMQSLVMVARALDMVDAGQVGVVGFGEDVFMAQTLDGSDAGGGGSGEGGGGFGGSGGGGFGGGAGGGAGWSASAHMGGRVLQQFSFAQQRTDVALLLRRVLDMLGAARRNSPSGSGGELWQLALVLSDGLTPSATHEAIRRLVREAHQARVMVVFIILDGGAESVVQLKEARFVSEEGGGGGGGGESRVVVQRYLDSFPFEYYLIVRRLHELPGALAALLRTWFAEVAGI